MRSEHFWTLGWTALVVGLLLAPGGWIEQLGPETDWQPAYADKLLHAALFGVLAWLASRSLRAAGVRHPRLAALLAAAALGGFLELVQPLVARDADLLDALANTAGAALAALLPAP